MFEIKFWLRKFLHLTVSHIGFLSEPGYGTILSIKWKRDSAISFPTDFG